MKWIAWITAMLLGLMWLLSEISPGGVSTMADTYVPPRWGYFPAGHPAAATNDPPHQPALHPAVVAAFESLLCLTALTALADFRDGKTRR